MKLSVESITFDSGFAQSVTVKSFTRPAGCGASTFGNGRVASRVSPSRARAVEVSVGAADRRTTKTEPNGVQLDGDAHAPRLALEDRGGSDRAARRVPQLGPTATHAERADQPLVRPPLVREEVDVGPSDHPVDPGDGRVAGAGRDLDVGRRAQPLEHGRQRLSPEHLPLAERALDRSVVPGPAPQLASEPRELLVAPGMVAEAGSRFGRRSHEDQPLANEGVELPQQREGEGPLSLEDQHPVAHAVGQDEPAAVDPRPPQEDLGVHQVVVVPLGRRRVELVPVDPACRRRRPRP